MWDKYKKKEIKVFFKYTHLLNCLKTSGRKKYGMHLKQEINIKLSLSKLWKEWKEDIAALALNLEKNSWLLLLPLLSNHKELEIKSCS